MSRDPRVIAALRIARSETQITDVIAAVCAEPLVAGRFVRALLEASPRPPAWLADAADAWRCTREVPIRDGRVDLVFEDAPTGRVVFVEVKVHSGFHRTQLRRCLDALPRESDRAALVALTRTTPTKGEEAATKDARWAGSVRWARVLPALRRLAPTPAAVEAQWHTFLDVLEEEGAMGFTAPQPRLLDAWAAARSAEEHVKLLLDALHDRARGLALGLGAHADNEQPPPDPFVRSAGGRPEQLVDRDARYALRVPADGPERVRLGLRGWQPPLRMMIAVRAAKEGDDPAWELRPKLIAAGYETRSGSRFLYRYRVVTDAEKADPALPEVIADWLEREADALVAMGAGELWTAAPTDPPAPEDKERSGTDSDGRHDQAPRSEGVRES